MADIQNDDIELDTDNDELDSVDTGSDTDNDTSQPAPGSQDDGSFIAELGDDDATGATHTDTTNNDQEDDDPDREAIRERRRQEKADRRQRVKEREERMKRELESERTARRQLEERLSLVERKATGAEVAQLDHAMNQMRSAYNNCKEQVRIGQESGNGAMVADATDKMLQVQQRYNQIEQIKKAYLQNQNKPAPLDPMITNHARTFMDKHKWYRADGSDDDSMITRTLDTKLAQEGWNPSTPEYWAELDSRIKKYLPHRNSRGSVGNASDGQQSSVREPAPKPRSPVGGSGREGSVSGSQKGTFRLSPERVQAIKDAGNWDDAKRRETAVRYYRDYDKANKGR